MVDIVVRPLALADIAVLVEIDHSYHTDYVWQMDIKTAESEVNVIFREVRLPRSMRVEYPRDPSLLFEDWQNRPGLRQKRAVRLRGFNRDTRDYRRCGANERRRTVRRYRFGGRGS